MKSKIFCLALLFIFVSSCSSDNSSENPPALEEIFIITIDKDTANEIVIDIDDPDSQIPCESFGFTAPNTQSNDTQLSNLTFNVPGSIVVDLDTIEVGETVPNYDLGPLSWNFTFTLNGITYEASAGFLSFSKYDDSAWVTTGDPILISGVLDIEVTEIGGSETRTVLINFSDVQVSYAGGC